MKDVFETIHERRSHRSYTGKTVSYDDLKAIADAGLHAPTVNDLRTVQFVLVNDGRKIQRMSDNAGDQTWIRGAGGLIAVITNDERLESYQDDAERLHAEHVGATMQNMSLAATALGLGSCWVERYDDRVVEKVFSEPPGNDFSDDEDESLRAVLVVGHTDRDPTDKPAMHPENHIFFDEYEERLEDHKYVRGQYYEHLRKIGYNVAKDTRSALGPYKDLWDKLLDIFR